jgi:hypothetical protein
VKVAAGSEREVEVFTDAEIERLLFYIQLEEITSRDRTGNTHAPVHWRESIRIGECKARRY